MRRWLTAALFIPSFYGFVTWGVTLGLYSMRLIDWHHSTGHAMAIYGAVLACFGLSALFFIRFYGNAIEELARAAETVKPATWRPGAWWYVSDRALSWLHVIGLFGLVLYVREILGHFEDTAALLAALLYDSYLIRQAEIDVLGLYFAYIGWIAIPLTILRWRLGGRPSKWLIAAVVFQCLGNLLFIDRTRPIWLVFISVMILFPFVDRLHPANLIRRALGLAAFGLLAFQLIGMWVGKIGEGFSHYGYVGIGQELSVLYYYLTGGFAYFDEVLANTGEFDDIPQRSLYPLFKAGSMLGLLPEPVSQILPFIEAPFPTNVGTFLEPYFSDGGMLYLSMGVLLCTVGVDFLALVLLRVRNPFATFCWANLCFVSFIAFFVPKLVSTPIWLFIVIACLSIFLRKLRWSASRDPASALPLPAVRRLVSAPAPALVPGFEGAIPFLERAGNPYDALGLPPLAANPFDEAPAPESHKIEAPASTVLKRRVRVLFLTRYGREGPSSRVRAIQFLPALAAHGIEAHCSPLLPSDYLAHRFEGRVPLSIVAPAYVRRIQALLNARDFDVLWIEKELFPWLPALSERLAQFTHRPLVVDYDDAVFERYDSHPNPLARGLFAGKIDAVMRRADIVTVGNEYLAAHARAAGARQVEILPSVVDTDRYILAPRPAESPFTVGWIGSPSTAPYLELVRPALEEVLRGLHARVRVIGGGAGALEGLDIQRMQWHEAEEAAELSAIDVGIMPLPDGPWERGKCGYKLVQYMAAGRPVIASPVGVNTTLVSHGREGFLATTNAQWGEAFAELYLSRERRETMGRAARDKVVAHYSLRVVAPRLARLLRSVAR